VNKIFLPFKEARKIARSLGLNSFTEWRKYAKSKKRPINIPSSPCRTYEKNGWIGLIDWLDIKHIDGYKRKYKVNDNYFKTWSHNMAYILGFWWADGYISEGRFGITQHIDDIYMLEKISKEMKSSYIISTSKKRNVAEIRISSNTIINDLLKLDGNYRKSLICKFPYIPKKYLPDFIRGLWDGDGCIYYNNHQKVYMAVFTSGSKNFIEKLLLTLRKNIVGFRGNIHEKCNKKGFKICNKKLKKDSICYNLVISANDTRRLKKFIYYKNNILKMDRKWKKFKLVGEVNLSTREKTFLSYDAAIKIIKKENIKDVVGWNNYCKSGKRDIGIPSVPYKVYKNKGWIDWYSWLGIKKIKCLDYNVIRVMRKNKKIKYLVKYLDYNTAIKYVHKLGLKDMNDWKKYCKSNKKPHNIPSHPRYVYENKGWKSSCHWLGNQGWETWSKKEFLSFIKAKKIVRRLKLRNNKDWRNACENKKIQINIPRSPDIYYKNKGWISWGNWLGTNTISNKIKGWKFYSFKKAHSFVKGLKLNSQAEWYGWAISKSRPIYIPFIPYRTYKKEWKGWGNWLGTNKKVGGFHGDGGKKYRIVLEKQSLIHTQKTI